MRHEISIEVMHDAAVIFAKFRTTFTVAEFTEFLQPQWRGLEGEQVDEALSELAGAGKLRQVGPGVYAGLPT